MSAVDRITEITTKWWTDRQYTQHEYGGEKDDSYSGQDKATQHKTLPCYYSGYYTI